MTKPTKIIRPTSKNNGISPDTIIIDDLDDNNIATSPEIAAERLKWIPNQPSPSFLGNKVIVYADIAGGADRKIEGMVTLINGELIYLALNPD